MVGPPRGDGWVHGNCPFCRAELAVKWDDDADGNGEIVHREPLCEAFRTKSGDEFVDAILHGEHYS